MKHKYVQSSLPITFVSRLCKDNLQVAVNMRSSFVAAALLATVQAQSGPVDPSTTKDCTFYDTAADSSYTCAKFEDIWLISHEDFVKWVSLLHIFSQLQLIC